MEKYALHLAKDRVKKLTHFLTESAREQLKRGEAEIIQRRQKLAFPVLLIGWKGTPQLPDWARKLNNHFDVQKKLQAQSSAAVLLFKVKNRVFAATYGYGHAFIEKSRRENDFGLFVAVNAMNDGELRNVEKTNLGSAIRDYAQSSTKARLGLFRIDEALDVIRKIAGASKESFLGSISGTSSLLVTADYPIEELDELSDELLKLFASKAYQKTEFEILDRLRPILDHDLIDELDQECVKLLQAASLDFELALPVTIAQPIGYAKFEKAKIGQKFADVTLSDYLDAVPNKTALCVDDLKKHKLAVFDLGTDKLIDRWSIHSALIGSLTHRGVRYAINEGNWYSVKAALVTAANSHFASCKCRLDPTLPSWPRKTVGKKKKKSATAYMDEGDYLKLAQAQSGYMLLDRKLISIPGEAGPGIEVCDLLDIKGRRFIHVKKSARKSALISHHIKQAANAARCLKTYPEFYDAFLSLCEKTAGKRTADAIRTAGIADWTFELRMGDKPNVKRGFVIPFFSRISLMEASRLVKSYDFQFKVGFIQLVV